MAVSCFSAFDVSASFKNSIHPGYLTRHMAYNLPSLHYTYSIRVLIYWYYWFTVIIPQIHENNKCNYDVRYIWLIMKSVPEYKHLSLIMLNIKHFWPRCHKSIPAKTLWDWNHKCLAQWVCPHYFTVCVWHIMATSFKLWVI